MQSASQLLHSGMLGDSILSKIMKQRGSLPLLLTLMLTVIPHRADAWSTVASKTNTTVRVAEKLVEE